MASNTKTGSSSSTEVTSYPHLILRGTNGLGLYHGKAPYERLVTVTDPNSQQGRKIKCIDVSSDGKYLAYAHESAVRVVTLPSLELVFENLNPNITYIKLSPRNSVLATWQHNNQSLNIFDIKKNVLLTSIIQKKQSRWCPHWTPDESVCVNHLNMELHFYENNQYERYSKKLVTQKVTSYSMVTHINTHKHYLACYSTGSKGQPNFVRIFEYPNFEGLGIANKSFYKADSVTMKWNSKGDAMLLLCSFDVDSSNKSYYGTQSLHFLDIKGNTYIIQLNKVGPIHNIEWLPSTKESLFCVIYGFMPAKAALFNNKATIVHDFGEQKINVISFNKFGNLLALAGFGNLRGGVNVWDMKTKNMVGVFNSPETTNIEWSPDGRHIMTGTTSPRLKVGNGFRIWEESGKKLHEELFDEHTEVYDIKWQPSDEFTEPKIVSTSVMPAKPAEPVKYVPPHLRTAQYENQVKKAAENQKKEEDPMAKAVSESKKKMSALGRKLSEIEKLKAKKAAGEKLEKNQIEKITKEEEIVAEMEALKLNLDEWVH